MLQLRLCHETAVGGPLGLELSQAAGFSVQPAALHFKCWQRNPELPITQARQTHDPKLDLQLHELKLDHRG